MVSDRIRTSPPVIYINHYAGEGGQWFLKRHGTKYVRADLAQSAEAPAWRPIETAPTDGTLVWVFVAERDGLPSFQCACAYHEDAGWCCDELREVTHWMPIKELAAAIPDPVA